jgi:hypothetical protein
MLVVVLMLVMMVIMIVMVTVIVIVVVAAFLVRVVMMIAGTRPNGKPEKHSPQPDQAEDSESAPEDITVEVPGQHGRIGRIEILEIIGQDGNDSEQTAHGDGAQLLHVIGGVIVRMFVRMAHKRFLLIPEDSSVSISNLPGLQYLKYPSQRKWVISAYRNT